MTVSILGCGWLGFPLAVRLIAEGIVVKGSTTTENKIELLKNAGITPYLIQIEQGKNTNLTNDFFDCDTLVFNIPPKRRLRDIEKNYLQIINYVIEKITQNNIQNLIFISSTSVYPANNKVVTEKDASPEKLSGKALLKAENLFNEQKQNTTILRFGGLIGYSRSALSLLKNKKEINNASSPLNLIHRDDCVEIIYKIIRENKWGYTFNASADEHPLRKDFYLRACQKHNLAPPIFNNTNNNYKIVSSNFLKSTLTYEFKYPNPLEI